MEIGCGMENPDGNDNEEIQNAEGGSEVRCNRDAVFYLV